MVVRNTDAAALTSKRIVKWEDRDVHQVDYATESAHGPLIAGVVDPLLGTTTVPVNGNCYIAVGVCTVSLGTTALVAAAGDFLVPSADSDKGKCDPFALNGAGSESVQLGTVRNRFAVALASANFNTNVEAEVNPFIKWW